MKRTSKRFVSTALVLAFASSANAQTLGTAENYDILVLNDGKIELKDGNQLFGNVGFSDGVDVAKAENIQNWDGTLFLHSGAKSFDQSKINPSGGIQTGSSVDSALNQANTDLQSYASYLGGLSPADATFSGTYQNAFSYSTGKSLTVIDFAKIDTSDKNFTFTGRASGTDQLVIRISDEFKFTGGDVILNDIKTENLIWYLSSNKAFDLHKGFSNFQGTIVAPLAQVTLGETDFTGKVYGKEIKMGSGFVYQVPEPSSSLMVLLGATGLLLTRRRSS